MHFGAEKEDIMAYKWIFWRIIKTKWLLFLKNDQGVIHYKRVYFRSVLAVVVDVIRKTET
jgi:hypothetical protein